MLASAHLYATEIAKIESSLRDDPYYDYYFGNSHATDVSRFSEDQDYWGMRRVSINPDNAIMGHIGVSLDPVCRVAKWLSIISYRKGINRILMEDFIKFIGLVSHRGIDRINFNISVNNPHWKFSKRIKEKYEIEYCGIRPKSFINRGGEISDEVLYQIKL